MRRTSHSTGYEIWFTVRSLHRSLFRELSRYSVYIKRFFDGVEPTKFVCTRSMATSKTVIPDVGRKPKAKNAFKCEFKHAEVTPFRCCIHTMAKIPGFHESGSAFLFKGTLSGIVRDRDSLLENVTRVFSNRTLEAYFIYNFLEPTWLKPTNMIFCFIRL